VFISPTDVCKPQQFDQRNRLKNHHYIYIYLLFLVFRSRARWRIPVPSAITGHAAAKRAKKRAKKAALWAGFALFFGLGVSQGVSPWGHHLLPPKLGSGAEKPNTKAAQLSALALSF